MTINTHLIIITLMFIVFDICTGVLSAFIVGDFKSSIMRRGGLRKLFLCVVIIFGIMLDYAQYSVDLGINVPAMEAICGYVCIMEIMSIIENINKGFPDALPKALTKLLKAKADEVGVPTKETEDEK